MVFSLAARRWFSTSDRAGSLLAGVLAMTLASLVAAEDQKAEPKADVPVPAIPAIQIKGVFRAIQILPAQVEKAEEKPADKAADKAEEKPADKKEEPAPEKATPEKKEETPPAVQAPPPLPAELEALVRKLGHNEYKERKQAADKLTAIGLPARDALLGGLKFPDPEVRRACRRILASVLEEDYQKRLAAFVADSDGKLDHQLPGWTRFKEQIGSDKPARELFADMQRSESALLEAIDSHPEQAADALSQRFAQIYSQIYQPVPNSRKQIEAGSIATLLFELSDPGLKLPPNVVDNPYLPQLLYQPAFQQFFQGNKPNPASRKLLGVWIRQPSGPNMLSQKLNLALQHDIKEGLDLALDFIKDKKQPFGGYKAQAINAIGKLGGKEYCQVLAELLTDETLCMQRIINNKQIPIQIRDVALGWLIFLTDQDHNAYFMPQAKQAFDQHKQNRQVQVSYAMLGFESDEKRTEALAKWKAWVAEHPLPKLPEKKAEGTAVEGQKKEGKKEEKRDEEKKPADDVPGAEKKPEGEKKDGDKKEDERGNAEKKAEAEKSDKEKQAAADQKAKDDQVKKEAVKQAARVPAAAPAPAPIQVQVQAVQIAVPGGIAVGPAPLPAKKVADGKPKPDPELGAGLERASREKVQVLILARKLIQQQEYVAATEALDQILNDEVDYAFQPDKSIPLFTGFKTEAERLLGDLPAAGIQAYELQCGAKAQEALDAAIEGGELSALSSVVHRYFHTLAGGRACYVLGTRLRIAGEPFRAALYLSKLRHRGRIAETYEPELSLQLAASWLQSGSPDLARRVMEDLLRRRPADNVTVGGEASQLAADPIKAVAWLQARTGVPVQDLAGGWLLYRGDAARNQSTLVSGPFLAADPILKLEPGLVATTLTAIRKDQTQQRISPIPTLHPLVIGDAIVFRTATQIVSLDAKTQELLWETPVDDSLGQLIHVREPGLVKQQEELVRRGLERRFFDDATFGTLAAHNGLVYAVEDLSFETTSDNLRLVVAPDGKRRLDIGTTRRFNTLVAYDLASGKIRWELGGPPGEGALPQAGFYFAGPPLPLAGRLYVLARTHDTVQTQQQIGWPMVPTTTIRTHLLELDQATGGLLARMELGDTQEVTMAQFMPWMGAAATPRQGPRIAASPSSSEGILLCPVTERRFVALDLASKNVLWIFDAPKDMEGDDNRLAMMMNFGFNPAMMPDTDTNDRWSDASVTIADGRAVLTPLGTDRVYCVGLHNGQLHWTASRRDGLYVAGASKGNLLVVGRGNLWGLKIADGTPAWAQASVPLPPGAYPSGRGFFGDGRYQLPLSTAEVAAIDVGRGQIVARSKSASGLVPGNLVTWHDRIVSQTPEGVWQFPSLTERLAATAKALAEDEKDPQRQLAHGEALLFEGQLAPATELLHKALVGGAGPRARQLLLAALADGLRTDVKTFKDLVAQFDKLLDQEEHREELLKRIAVALHESGQYEQAFQVYLRLANLDRTDYALEPESAASDIRRDRWIQGQLDQLRSAVPAEMREKFDREVAAKLSDDKLRPFLAYFACFPSANEARLKLAEKLASQKQSFEAELVLRHVIRTAQPEVARGAVARLAKLLRESGQPIPAAVVYRHLAGELKDQVCEGELTGGKIVASLAADDPVRKWLEVPSPWPVGPAKKEIVSGNQGVAYRFPMLVTSDDGPLGLGASADIDPGGTAIYGVDSYGRQKWQIQLGQPNTQNWAFNGNVAGFCQGRVLGQALYGWTGHRVVAVDGSASGGKLLWSLDTIVSKAPFQNAPRMFAFGMRPFRPAEGLPGASAQMLVATGTYVAFQRERQLVAVDPLNGQILWTRDVLRETCDLFGDEERIFVTPSGAEETLVLSAIDGREVGRKLLPPLEQRMTNLGRRLVLWEKGAGQASLRMVDAWSGEQLWRENFAPDAYPWLCRRGEAGVLDPAGNFAVVGLEQGKKLASAQLGPQEGLTEAVVLGNSEGYTVIACRPQEQKGPANQFFHQQFPGTMMVSGVMYGVKTGQDKPAWSRPMVEHMLRPEQPAEIPLVVCCTQVYQNDGKNGKHFEKQFVVDKRTGEVLLDEQTQPSGMLYQMTGDPDSRKIEIKTQQRTIRYEFGAK